MLRRLHESTTSDTETPTPRRLSWLRVFAVGMCLCFSMVPMSPVIVGVAAACEGAGEEEFEVGGGSPVTFPNVKVGESFEKIVEVENESFFTTNVIRQEIIPFVGNGFTLNSSSPKDTCKGTLGPHVTCKAPIIFKPAEKRKYESELETELEMTIFPNRRDHGSIVLKGQGV